MMYAQEFVVEAGWLAIASWLAAIVVLFAWQKTGKPHLIYTHVILLILPMIVFAARLSCSTTWLSSLSSFCSMMWTKLIMYLIPIVVSAGVLIGYVLLPKLTQLRLRAKPLHDAQLRRRAKDVGLQHTTFLWFDSAEPIAFSSRDNIFLSQGLFELLSKNQLDAVVLHELYHVKSGSDWIKFSSIFGRTISPLARFSTSSTTLHRDEQEADAFASRIQGIATHVLKARQKMHAYQTEIGHNL